MCGIKVPTIYVEVGKEFTYRGVVYRCEVVDCKRLNPCDACRGCAFNIKKRNCDLLQCSSFDRSDRTKVWFKEIKVIG